MFSESAAAGRTAGMACACASSPAPPTPHILSSPFPASLLPLFFHHASFLCLPFFLHPSSFVPLSPPSLVFVCLPFLVSLLFSLSAFFVCHPLSLPSFLPVSLPPFLSVPSSWFPVTGCLGVSVTGRIERDDKPALLSHVLYSEHILSDNTCRGLFDSI